MSRAPASARRRADEVERLRSAADQIAQELIDLGNRVSGLSEAIAAIGADPGATDDGAFGDSGRSGSPRTTYEEFRVTVRPLPELAMAAVAETSLRGLPGVKQVLSVERMEDWASFILEVSTEVDLISEMRAAMPVGFNVTDSKPNELSLELKWLWGADSA
jgi:hypothetical protein